MRCKKHFTDLSSSVGVCASCLRERLFSLIAAQAQAQAHAHVLSQTQALEDHRKSDTHPPPLAFPRSVSPYISRRKAGNAAWPNHHHDHHHSLSDQRFYSTPQVGPTGAIVAPSSYKKHSKFSLLSNFFRSKSRNANSDMGSGVSVSESRESCATATSSSSWLSSILSGRRKKQSRLYYLDESTNAAAAGQRQCRNQDRGMSPARYFEDGGEDEFCDGSSGYSSESSQGCKQTPARAGQTVRRGSGRPLHPRNVSGLAFCLSPLVRASPNRHWNQKGMPAEVAFSGEFRVPVKPHLSNAKSFCANRSRKLADFGRFNPNR